MSAPRRGLRSGAFFNTEVEGARLAEWVGDLVDGNASDVPTQR